MRIQLCALTLAVTAAQSGWEARLGGVSDYVYRGVSQTRGGPALQAETSAWLASGFYVSGWASAVDYEGSDTPCELSAGLGWSGEAGPWTLDLGVQRYHYPGEPEFGYPEALMSASAGPFVLEAAWSPDMAGSGSPGGYLAVATEREAGPVLLRSRLGWSWYSQKAGDDLFGPEQPRSYVDGSLGLGWSVAGVDLGLDWQLSDVHTARMFPDVAGQRVVFSLGKAWGRE